MDAPTIRFRCLAGQIEAPIWVPPLVSQGALLGALLGKWSCPFGTSVGQPGRLFFWVFRQLLESWF